MTDAVKARLFKPFFTTKEKGKELGWALPRFTASSVKRRRYRNRDRVGSWHDLPDLLPQIDAQAQDKDKDKDKDVVLQGTETVLLVEDEEAFAVLGRALTVNRYFVLTAATGRRR